MATLVESRECLKCRTQYRTKVRKGKDTRSCPECQGTVVVEPPKVATHYPPALIELIRTLATAPASQLADAGRKLCSEYREDNPVRFLRDLRDLCVRYSWSSGMVVNLISTALQAFPEESTLENEARLQALQGQWEPAH